MILSLIFAISTAVSTNAPLKAEGQPEPRNSAQLSEELKAVLGCDEEKLRSGDFTPSDELYSCVIWLFDIDFEEPIRAGLTAAELTRGGGENPVLPYSVILYKDGEKDISVEIDSDADAEYVQTYIETKRAVARELYLEQNTNFAERALDESSIIYISAYSPCIFVNLTIGQIAVLLNSEEIVLMDYENSADYVNESEDESLTQTDIYNLHNVKMADTNINATKQLYNVSGWNVKIGQVEAGVPTASAVIKNQNLLYGGTVDRIHADNVYTIMHEIAPNATYYASGLKDGSGSNQLYSAVEWLIGQGVNVINMSMGGNPISSPLNTYGISSRWLDHLAFNHDVHVVKSAGNYGQSGVSTPGMANNIITVGNVDDNHTIYYTSSYNTGLNSTQSAMCKPDMMAPGVYSSDNAGTSYSAPMVTATIALMGNKWPATLTQQHLVKTALTVGTSITCGRYVTLSSYFRQYGAGVLDARAAFYIINNNQYVSLGTVSSSNTTATYTFYIPSAESTVRIGLTYTNRIVFPSSNGHTNVNNTPAGTIGNLSIEVLSPSGVQVKLLTWQNANVKIVEFNSATFGAGTYTVKIKQEQAASGDRPTKFSWGWFRGFVN